MSLSAPVISAAGREAATKVIFALDRLREKYPSAIPFDDLLAYTMKDSDRQDETQVRLFRKYLEINEKIKHDRTTNTFRFRPYHDIASADELLAFLQQQDNALGIDVRKLKEGWPDAEESITLLESQHKLLVSRNKKDNHARMVWANDPSLVAPLDQEFKDIWMGVALPPKEDVIRQLQQMQYTPTGEIVKTEVNNRPVKKVRKVRRGAKVTNTHISSMLKDYSDRRPVGK